MNPEKALLHLQWANNTIFKTLVAVEFGYMEEGPTGVTGVSGKPGYTMCASNFDPKFSRGIFTHSTYLESHLSLSWTFPAFLLNDYYGNKI